MINVACPCLQPAQYRPHYRILHKLGKSGTRRSPGVPRPPDPAIFCCLEEPVSPPGAPERGRCGALLLTGTQDLG